VKAKRHTPNQVIAKLWNSPAFVDT
jgi:hypothetical protein